jgi:hypothetical protein
MEYVSAAEGMRYAEVIKETGTKMKALGKEKIKAKNANSSRCYTTCSNA